MLDSGMFNEKLKYVSVVLTNRWLESFSNWALFIGAGDSGIVSGGMIELGCLMVHLRYGNNLVIVFHVVKLMRY